MKSLHIALMLSLTMFVTSSYAANFGNATDQTASDVQKENSASATSQLQNIASAVQTNQDKSAEDRAYDFIENARQSGTLDSGNGWNDKCKTFVVIGTAQYDTRSVSTSDQYLKMRVIKGLEAQLNAKSDIINFIRTKLSVDNLLTMPETGLSTEFDNQKQQLQNEIQKATQEYQSMLDSLQATQKNNIEELSLSEILNEGIKAVIYKIDSNVDWNSISDNKKQKINIMKEKLLNLQTKIDSLKEKAKQLQFSLGQEQISKVESISKIPLVGAVTVAQFESHLNNIYQISYVITWSPKQEKAIRAIMKGEAVEMPKGKNLGDYLASNDWSTAIGGRKFLNENGDYIILGIGAWPITGTSGIARRQAEGFAKLYAQSGVASMLYGDVEAKSIAAQKVQELHAANLNNGDSDTTIQTTENFAQTLSDSLQNLHLQGLSRVFGKEMIHPIFGQKMYVAIYSLSVSQSIQARKMEKINFEDAMAITNSNNFNHGEKDGMDSALKSRQESVSDYNNGFEKGNTIQPGQSSVLEKNTKKAVPQAKKLTPNGKVKSFDGAGSSPDSFTF